MRLLYLSGVGGGGGKKKKKTRDTLSAFQVMPYVIVLGGILIVNNQVAVWYQLMLVSEWNVVIHSSEAPGVNHRVHVCGGGERGRKEGSQSGYGDFAGRYPIC